MSVANLEYNPHWKVIHDYHDTHRTRLEEKIREYHKGAFQDNETVNFTELKQEWKFHHETCKHILTRVQHKTVAAFAKWLFEQFGDGMDLSSVPPYDEFKTLDQVTDLWQAIEKKNRESMIVQGASQG